MNAPLDLTMDKATFLRWAERQEGRYELEGGRVVQQMTGGTLRHSDLSSAIVSALGQQLDRTIWAITIDGPGIDLVGANGKPFVRYPDVVVRRQGDPATALSIATPTVIFEVLSPSSVTLDLVVKPAEYMSLASLEAYIVASQDEPRVTIWERAVGGERTFPRLPIELDKGDDVIGIAALGLAVPLAELYRGILDFPA